MTLERPPLRDVWDGFGDHELATYASAIAFRVLFAAVPFALFVLALAGLLHLDDVWSRDLAPDIEPQVSGAVFTVLDDTVRAVLSGHQVFWLTAGLALALWAMGSAVRAAAGALDEVYGCERSPGFWERLPKSLWLGAALGTCLVGAIAVLRFSPLALGDHGRAVGVLSAVVRYAIGAALLGLAVGLLVSHAPATHQPVRWVSFGSVVVVAGWIVTWAAYGFYLTRLASYGSVYGAFATVVVLLTFLHLSAMVLLAGTLVDALVREETTGDRDGG